MTLALKPSLAILLSLLLAVPTFAQHSHGKGSLQLSLNGDVLQGQWTMPMEALLGFEHLPKTAAQQDVEHGNGHHVQGFGTVGQAGKYL